MCMSTRESIPGVVNEEKNVKPNTMAPNKGWTEF